MVHLQYSLLYGAFHGGTTISIFAITFAACYVARLVNENTPSAEPWLVVIIASFISVFKLIPATMAPFQLGMGLSMMIAVRMFGIFAGLAMVVWACIGAVVLIKA